MAAELEPLAPPPTEIAISIISVLTVVFCVFVVAQVIRGRWTVRHGFALIVLAILLPIVGPLLRYWLVQRARRKPLALSS